MKIAIINHSDNLGGASVVTFRLLEALCRAGADARLIVGHKNTDSLRVAEVEEQKQLKFSFLREHAGIFVQNGFSRENLFKISIANSGLPLYRHPWVREADVVMLNWVNQGLLSLDGIRKIAESKPTIWTMHDMWNLTGGCHHAGTCNLYCSHCHDCPLLGRMSGPHDLSYRHFNAKQSLYDNTNITFVAVSSWLHNCAKKSALLSHRDIRLIHTPYPIDTLSAPAQLTRSALGLPEHRPLIMISAARLDDPVKDLPTAISALNVLAERGSDALALLVGAIKNPHALDSLRLPYVTTGAVFDKTRLHSLAAHSSVVLSTSKFESFGATLLEGQAAGATPVGFTHDGRADIITDNITGYALPPNHTPETIADTLEKALEHPIPRHQLLHAANRYNADTIADHYLALCEQIRLK